MADRTWTGRLVLQGEKKGVTSAFKGASKNVDGFASSLKRLGAVVGVAAVGKLFLDTANTIRVFEKSISGLSAITGATGKALDRLRDAAKRMGRTTTLSAVQVAEGFQIMASAKPDLLENLDALEATTAAAITLAEAAGLELPTAATALGEALNQFGKGAEDANRFINVLAAGSQKGAALINQVNLSLKGAGVAASQAGLTFEQTNAQIQTLAFAGLKGAEAGTKLRTVLVKLQNQANDKFNPAVVGVNAALKNLADANLSVTEKVKLFGEEALITADILIKNQKASEKLTIALTGTNTALEQSKTNTDNLEGSLDRLSSAYEGLQISNDKSTGAMRMFVDLGADMLNTLTLLNSDSSPGSVSVAAGLFETLGFTLKTLFTGGIVLKNLFDNVLNVLGFVAKAIARLLERDFAGINDDFAELAVNIEKNFEDIGTAAAGVFNPEMAKEFNENMRVHFAEPAIQSAKELAAQLALEVKIAAEQQAAADAVVAARKLEKGKEDDAKRIERIRLRNRTEREVAVQFFQTRLEENAELFKEGLISEEQLQERRINLSQQTADKLIAIDHARAAAELTFATMTSKQKTQTILGEAVRLTQGVATTNKTLFTINKAAALAQAIVAMPAHVSETMSKYPFPISVVMGALAAAASLAQIAAIKGASFSGGGMGTTPSVAGSVPTINSFPLGGTPGGGGTVPPDVGGLGGLPNQQVNIKIEGLDEGGLLSADQVRALMMSISDQLGDGVEIDIGG